MGESRWVLGLECSCTPVSLTDACGPRPQTIIRDRPTNTTAKKLQTHHTLPVHSCVDMNNQNLLEHTSSETRGRLVWLAGCALAESVVETARRRSTQQQVLAHARSPASQSLGRGQVQRRKRESAQRAFERVGSLLARVPRQRYHRATCQDFARYD